ncbi:CbrC family protein [Aureivirga marina]|nr:CbrC family protein [Aureivirga marina]
MEFPKFKYSPNAYELDLFEKEEGICSVFNEPLYWFRND